MADIDGLIYQNMMAFAKEERGKSLKFMAEKYSFPSRMCTNCGTAQDIMPSIYGLPNPICRNCVADVAFDINNAIRAFDAKRANKEKR